MKYNRLSLQFRIFIAMLFIVFIASLFIVLVTVFQYTQQANDYHIKRLNRKESAIKRDIQHTLRNTTWFVNTKNLKYIFRDEIYIISNIHGMELNLYDFDGNLIKSSRVHLVRGKQGLEQKLPRKIVEALHHNIPGHHIVKEVENDTVKYKISYSYIHDPKGNPIAILAIPYIQESRFFQNELEEFLHRLLFVFLLVFITAVVIAYLLSRYISGSIKEVAEKIQETRLAEKNEKISIDKGSKEIFHLVDAYNEMIDKLDESARKLARSEREYAWREMAKQVAHEIKNPLTPMRLSIQNLERKINRGETPDPNEIKELTTSLIQQIDLMSAIASAFSDFAKMPKARTERLDITEVVRSTVELFPEPYIRFHAGESIEMEMDKSQLIRIVNNLITNSLQSLENRDNPLVEVRITYEKPFAVISVADNGKGIPDEIKDKIFEPKFTTKSKGMGLGLAMVKNIVESYGGTITFESTEGKGSVFTIRFHTGYATHNS